MKSAGGESKATACKREYIQNLIESDQKAAPMIRDFLETLAWGAIVTAYVCAESLRYRRLDCSFRKQGKIPLLISVMHSPCVHS